MTFIADNRQILGSYSIVLGLSLLLTLEDAYGQSFNPLCKTRINSDLPFHPFNAAVERTIFLNVE